MTSRRDILLKQMGIEQWELLHPHLLHGASSITIPIETKLVIISDIQATSSPLANDLYRSFGYEAQQAIWITPEQLLRITLEHSVNYCLFTSSSIDESALINAKHIIHCITWNDFQLSALAKRQLWQQIQKIQHSREYDE